jgi:hypothetical protein
MRRSLLLSLTALVALTAALAVSALTAPARAQALSSGCAVLNNPIFDRHYGSGSIEGQFAAGDHITITAGLPGSTDQKSVLLSIDDVVAVGGGWPATVEYTFPTAGSHKISWATDQARGTSTWAVGCSAFDLSGAITDLQATVSGMGLSKGTSTALNSPLQKALDALNANDTAGACGFLQSFLDEVNAHAGKKKLTATQAQQLTDAANAINTPLGC